MCRTALASSAVVCSTLSHHALNVLWREIDSMHPLLRTLPNLLHVDSQFVRQSSHFRNHNSHIHAQYSRHSLVQSRTKVGRGSGSMRIAYELLQGR